MIALFFQARGEKRRGKKGGSPSNEFLESLGPGSSAVGSQGSSDAGEYEEYDEPCPVLPNVGHLGPDQDLDYDDPVQRY